MIRPESPPTHFCEQPPYRPEARHAADVRWRSFVFRPLLVAACGVALFTQATAQTHPGLPDVERGARLAAKLCASCHASEADGTRRVKADVPTFREIANLPGQTPELLTGKIMVPRHPMPDLALSRDQIADVVAYIKSFKTPD